MKFEGIYTPAITPLTQEGNIDKGAFAEVLNPCWMPTSTASSSGLDRRILCAHAAGAF